MDLAAIARAMQARMDAPAGVDTDAVALLRPCGVQTDSRLLEPGELFFCIPGERFDGHDFAAQALEKGALAVVAERDVPLSERGVALKVDNVLAALGRLARAHRDAARAMVVGITGSSGKTTVKELLASICNRGGSTAKNHLNLNNQIGLPVSMLRASGEERFWVFEAGINYDGEMDILGSILAPDLALIVNVGGAHTRGLGGVDGVARNKTLLFKHLRPGGTAVYSADYPELVQAATAHAVNSVRFSIHSGGAPYVGRYLGPETQGRGCYYLEFEGRGLEVVLPWRGEFMAENAIAAAATAHLMGLDTTAIKTGLEATAPVEHRFQRIEAQGLLMVDDAYNANPFSMDKAIAGVLELARGRPLALVLGEMRELGGQAPAAHEQLGRLVAGSGATIFFWRGGHGEDVLQGLRDGGYDGRFVRVDETEAFLEQWRCMGLARGVVLFKGSRALRMEEFCEALRKELQA